MVIVGEKNMSGKKIKNPLLKRVPREFLGDWKKYIIVTLFLIVMIGATAGVYVANNSMLAAFDSMEDEYTLEDGHFELNKEADSELLEAIAAGEMADLRAYYTNKAHEELDERFEEEFTSEFNERFTEGFNSQFEEEFNSAFELQVENMVRSQVEGLNLPEEQVALMVESAIEESRNSEDYTVAYNEAYDEAYAEAYDEAYSEAYDEAYNEALAEIDTEIEDEISEAEEKYELNAPGFEAMAVTIYENFYLNLSEGEESRIRVFAYQEEVNLPCVHEGRLPSASEEIAIDRMHADNAGINVGDIINVGDREMEVVGLISLANYTTLHESNADTMFNALTFDVGLVTDEGFEALSLNRNVHYMYCWIYNEDPADKIAEKTAGDNFLKSLITQIACSDNSVEDFLPAYANQAIHFAPDDVGGDMAMVGILLYIFIGIIAFIFAVTISSTITKEASVIGTLRASGYTKGELIAHYMAMPIVVTLLAAVIGNALGYTLLKDSVKNLYYNSYSLPVFKTLWSSEAFVKTTIIPLVLVLLVNLVVIAYKLRLSPLKFLRHDLKTGKRRNAVKLPNFKFFSRFRLRILSQNSSNYLILAFGVIFVMFLTVFANAMPDTLEHIKSSVTDNLFADYQIILKSTEDDDGNVITTDNPDAEKFSITSLIYHGSIDEEISVYGFSDESRYYEIPSLGENEVVISKAFADKFGIRVGDTISLDEEFESVTYEFKVAYIDDVSELMSVFMGVGSFNKIFDLDEDSFSGFLSSTPIEDISDKYIAKTITIEDLLMQVNQLDHSMGSMLNYFGYVCVIMAAVLIYLLTKIIIEKNENAISMTKILGYKSGEIASLYLVSTTWVMLVCEFIAVFAGKVIMGIVWKEFLKSMPGWYPFFMKDSSAVKIFVLVFVAFLVIMFFDYMRIRRIPMDEALKNVE